MRTIGYAYAWNPNGTRAAYHIVSTVPGYLQLHYAGFIDHEGVRHPVTVEWDRMHGHSFWVLRASESYATVFFGHSPAYHRKEPSGAHRERLWVMRCVCGAERDNHTRELAELEFEVHTANLGR